MGVQQIQTCLPLAGLRSAFVHHFLTFAHKLWFQGTLTAAQLHWNALLVLTECPVESASSRCTNPPTFISFEFLNWPPATATAHTCGACFAFEWLTTVSHTFMSVSHTFIRHLNGRCSSILLVSAITMVDFSPWWKLVETGGKQQFKALTAAQLHWNTLLVLTECPVESASSRCANPQTFIPFEFLSWPPATGHRAHLWCLFCL